jgi:hypothetical protein
MTSINYINSASIRSALEATGDTYATKVGAYEHPEHAGEAEWRITLWLLPAGDFVVETNEDSIFEVSHPDDFAAICADYGIDEEVVS